MSKLEELRPNAAVRGILPDALVTVVSVQWFGSEALELTDQDPPARWRTGTRSPAVAAAARPLLRCLKPWDKGPALPPVQAWYVAGKRTFMGTGL